MIERMDRENLKTLHCAFLFFFFTQNNNNNFQTKFTFIFTNNNNFHHFSKTLRKENSTHESRFFLLAHSVAKFFCNYALKFKFRSKSKKNGSRSQLSTLNIQYYGASITKYISNNKNFPIYKQIPKQA